MIKDYKKIKMGNRSYNLVKIYEITKNYAKDELYGLVSQIRKTAVLKLFFFLTISSLFTIPLFCGEGTTTANFLKFSQSARQSAVAGAYSAVGDDVNSIFSNPAGISYIKQKELSLGFTTYLEGSRLGMLSYTTPLKDSYMAFGIIGFDIGSIEKRTDDAVGIVPSQGSFGANDMAFIVSFAKKDFLTSVLENLNAGLSFKFINSKIDNSSAFSLAVDVGAIYKYSDKMNISFAINNLGTKMKYEDESDDIPLSIKAGALYKINRLNLVGEIEEYVYDEKFYPSIGAEYFLKDSFILRTGYRFGYDTSNLGSMVGFSIGFGIVTKDVGFNYAYVPFGDLGNINRFDLQLKF